jgi:hypothetical protein
MAKKKKEEKKEVKVEKKWNVGGKTVSAATLDEAIKKAK